MNPDEEEDDDYMSDAILQQAEKNDVRPGLVPRSIARQYQQDAKSKEANLKNKTKPKHIMEKEEREKALNKTISSNNKGFSLLSKMGYKPGMSIGKEGKGRVDPIPISLKTNRTGLGHDTEIKRKIDKKNQLKSVIDEKKIKLEEKSRLNFRIQKSQQLREKKTLGYLKKSQKICEQLDSKRSLDQPIKIYFWPKNNQDNSESEKEDDEEDENNEDLPEPEEQLRELTCYLRNEYKYCIWCATSFEDDNDIQQNCPGNTAEDHDE